MYFQRDYILRMIEMMGDLMRRIGELLDDLHRMKMLDDATRRHAGIPLETAEALTADSLLTMLQPTPRLMVSEILYIKATSFQLLPEENDALLLKSLRLLASLWEEGPLCELRADRLLELKAQVLPLLSPADLLNCARFFGEAEYYADMEDALFQAAEILRAEEQSTQAQDMCPQNTETQAQSPAPANPSLSTLLAEGTAMLRQAATASPEVLTAVHISKDEMLQAAKDLACLGA